MLDGSFVLGRAESSLEGMRQTPSQGRPDSLTLGIPIYCRLREDQNSLDRWFLSVEVPLETEGDRLLSELGVDLAEEAPEE